MTETAGKLRYKGGFLGMRELGSYMREEGLEVTVETSAEHRDAVATIEAIITFASVPGTVVGLAELTAKARRAVTRYRAASKDNSAVIKIADRADDGPDDAGFLP
jgi:2-keto-3-deoxy-L-rhamnonate aldolase RhmA